MSTATLTATARIYDEALPGRHHRPMAETPGPAISWDRSPDSMTSRTAELLHVMAGSAHRLETDALAKSDGNDSAIAEMLPDATATMSPAWRYRFADCFAIWSQRLVDGAPLTPQNTAEEMALHIILDLAFAFVDKSEVDVASEEGLCGLPCDEGCDLELLLTGIPACDDDFRFGALADELFDDYDVLLLFGDDAEHWMDESSILAPRNWFLPFH